MNRLVLFSLLSLCVFRSWADFNCTSGCQVPSSYFDDSFCDCDDCSDEPNYSCETCNDGCPTSEQCLGDASYYNYCPVSTSGSGNSGSSSSNSSTSNSGSSSSNSSTSTNYVSYFDFDIDNTYVKCSQIWDKTSTAECQVNADFINDNECDCPSCEDEKYYTCETCGNGCVDESNAYSFDGATYCGYWTECDGSFSADLGMDCNFGIPDDFGVPVVEGTCFSVEYDWSIIPFLSTVNSVKSGIVNCNENGTASVTYYNNSNSCEDVEGTYTVPVPLYSCGGTADACDTYTIWYDLFLGNNTDSCSSNQRINIGAVYANLANVGCADDVKYSVSTDDGISIGYYYNGDLDGTCSGDVGYEFELSTLGCNKLSFFSQYLTVEAGIQQAAGEDSPYIKEVSGASRPVSVFGAVVVFVVSLFFV